MPPNLMERRGLVRGIPLVRLGLPTYPSGYDEKTWVPVMFHGNRTGSHEIPWDPTGTRGKSRGNQPKAQYANLLGEAGSGGRELPVVQ